MPATATSLRVQLRDGRVLETKHDAGVPERDLARQTERLRGKFDRLAPLPPKTRAAVSDLVFKLEQQPNLSELIALVAHA
jgi:hypothetical protein